jgi:ribosomal protein S8
MLSQCQREKPFVYFPFTQTRVQCAAVLLQHGFLRSVRKSEPRATKRIDYREMLY